MKFRTTLFLTSMALVLAACSGTPTRKEGEMRPEAEFTPYDQGSVGTMSYFGRFDGWRPVGRDKLFVWDGLSNGYLITVAPPCEELNFTNAIGFTQRVRGSVSVGLDEVRMSREACRITDIRRIDYKRMRDDERKDKA